MRTQQTIAIIGLDNNWQMLAQSLAHSKERVLLIDKNKEAATALASELTATYPSFEVEAMQCPANACWEADIIIISVSGEELQEVVTYSRAYANQKVVGIIRHNQQCTGAIAGLLPHSHIVWITPAENSWLLVSNEEEAIALIAETFNTAGAIIRFEAAKQVTV